MAERRDEDIRSIDPNIHEADEDEFEDVSDLDEKDRADTEEHDAEE